MLFSIITVTRNNLDGLKRTEASITGQSFDGYEWIVIDGASNDGTESYLIETSATYISEADNGIYDAMNKGIERAKGYFVIFMNAGDCFADENTLLNLVSYIEEVQETPDFIYGDALETTEADQVYKKAKPYQKADYGMFTHHQAMVYRRDKIGDLRYDQNFKIAADYKFTLAYLKNCDTVLYAPFPLCLFESGGLSQQNAKLGRHEQFVIRKNLKTVSLAKNWFIKICQFANWQLRRLAPALYWKTKQRR